MMMQAVPGAPRLVDPATQCAIYRVALSCQVVASVSHACERSDVWRSTVL
jgi:hypothetical protein